MCILRQRLCVASSRRDGNEAHRWLCLLMWEATVRRIRPIWRAQKLWRKVSSDESGQLAQLFSSELAVGRPGAPFLGIGDLPNPLHQVPYPLPRSC